MSERPVLVYDGDCAFCTRCVAWIDQHLPRLDATITAWQHTDLAPLGVTPARAAYEVLWVDRDGRVHGGAQAVGRLLVAAGVPWSVLGALLRAPLVRPVAAVVYRWVADHRHLMPGGTAACSLPAAQRPGAARAARAASSPGRAA